MASKRIALVTGGNKGIGFEICKQLVSTNDVLVVLTARDEQKGIEALDKLKTLDLATNVVFRQLDVKNPASIASLADFIRTQYGKLDILVNNAGIIGIVVDMEKFRSLNLPPGDGTRLSSEITKTFMTQTYESAKECIQTNYYGAKHVTEALLPLLKLSSYARIVNISSEMGKIENIIDDKAKSILSNVDGLTEEIVEEVVMGFLKDAKDGLLEEKGWKLPFSAYRVSKASINAYTQILAHKYSSFRINAVSPGPVKTDMTHNQGKYTVEEGARGPVKFALIANDGPSGRFFYQMEETSF